MRGELLDQVQQVARRLRRHELRASGVTIKIRYGEFETITRSRSLGEATDRTDLLWTTTLELFDEWAGKTFRPVRLIGMAARSLSRGRGQSSLFEDARGKKQEELDRAVDRIAEKFGDVSVRRGVKDLE